MNNQHVNPSYLISCNIIEQPAQPQMYYRPLTAKFSNEIAMELDSISSSFAFNNSTSNGLYQSVAPKLLQVSNAHTCGLHIPNGWGERRYFVALEVTTITQFAEYREIITGYTDHRDVVFNGHLNPDANIYPNNYMRYIATKDVYGNKSYSRIDINSQIVNGVTDINESHLVYGLRPKDTLISLGIEGLGIVNDSRVMAQAGGLLSARSNNIPSLYMGSVMNAYKRADLDLENFGDSNMLYSTAAEHSSINDNFNSLNFFNLIQMYGDYRATGYFKLGTLLQLWPDHNDGLYKVIHLDHRSIVDESLATESWGVTNIYTTIGASIANIVPSFLASRCIVSMTFTIATGNHAGNMTGQPICLLSGFTEMFEGVHTAQDIEAFKDIMVREIDNMLLANHVHVYEISVECNVYGNTRMSISIDNSVRVPLSAPNFCDNITAPVQSLNQAQTRDVALDLGRAINHVFETTSYSPSRSV